MRAPKLLPTQPREWLWLSLRLLVLACLGGYTIFFSVHMPRFSVVGPLPPLTPEETLLAKALHNHVYQLAGSIGQRNIWTAGSMESAAEYITAAMSTHGQHLDLQAFPVLGHISRNIALEIPGQGPSPEIIVVGAHYDTVLHSPGANDNASGVAALLELARLLAKEKPQRTIRLVAFANEESPFYYTNDMGSRHYARRCRKRGENIVAMLSLETMGCYRDTLKSQHYPFPLRLWYPDTGNFLAFVGNLPSRPLVHRAISAFRSQGRLPSEGIAAPSLITGIGWSDHWSFWQEGYQAIMLTDTAFFRSPLYHTAQDTEESLDYERLARATTGLRHTVLDLANQARH